MTINFDVKIIHSNSKKVFLINFVASDSEKFKDKVHFFAFLFDFKRKSKNLNKKYNLSLESYSWMGNLTHHGLNLRQFQHDTVRSCWGHCFLNSLNISSSLKVWKAIGRSQGNNKKNIPSQRVSGTKKSINNLVTSHLSVTQALVTCPSTSTHLWAPGTPLTQFFL